MTSLRMLVVVLAAALSCLQGCASALEAERAVDPDRLTALFRNYQADYIVMSRPSDLEKISQLVLVGRVAEVREGRTWQVPDVPWTKSTSVIVAVEPEKVLGGKSSTSEHRVFVELDNPGRLALSEYQTALSIGIRVIFYLSKAGSTKDTPDIASANGNEEIDSEIYLPVSPQGFGVAANSTVVWPLAGVTLEGTLEESFPSGHKLPQD